MFREMRRKKQLLSRDRMEELIRRNTSGTLALLGDDDYPYAIPLSYAYKDGKFFFHGASSGHKLDAIRKHDKASFCIVDYDQVVGEEFTTYFRSVIAFGRMKILEKSDEIREAMLSLSDKYTDFSKADQAAYIDKSMNFSAFVLRVEHMTGKEAIELVRMNNKKQR